MLDLEFRVIRRALVLERKREPDTNWTSFEASAVDLSYRRRTWCGYRYSEDVQMLSVDRLVTRKPGCAVLVAELIAGRKRLNQWESATWADTGRLELFGSNGNLPFGAWCEAIAIASVASASIADQDQQCGKRVPTEPRTSGAAVDSGRADDGSATDSESNRQAN